MVTPVRPVEAALACRAVEGEQEQEEGLEEDQAGYVLLWGILPQVIIVILNMETLHSTIF